MSTSPDGSQVVLARFPEEGKTLEAFGLNPSILKSIAIPQSLSEWSTSALSECSSLESLTSFGMEIEAPLLIVTAAHFSGCPNLKHFTIPSSVTIGPSTFENAQIQTVVFPASTRVVGPNAFRFAKLVSADFSKCKKLTTFQLDANASNTFVRCYQLSCLNLRFCRSLTKTGLRFCEYCPKIKTLDFSNCTSLKIISQDSFYSNSTCDSMNLHTVIFPPSLTTIEIFAFEYGTGSSYVDIPSLRTLIWKGRTTRPAISNENYPTSGISYRAFSHSQTLDELVKEGRIQEIFVP